MAAKQHRIGSPCDEDVSGLQLQELPLTTGNGTILCDLSTPFHRPFVPPSPRRNVFSSLHNLSLPWSWATDKLVSDRFVWSGTRKDLKAWIWACIAHQRSRIQRHNKAPIGTFPGLGARFCHVHLDIPDLDCSDAEMVFGATVRLTGEIISPNPRGVVGDPNSLLHRLRQLMRTPSLVPPRSSASPSYLEKDLAVGAYVYLRYGRVRWPLEPPYDGLFRVLSRRTKAFHI
nr:unnamed protein product [Spirometra erinaceieuropaei]